MPWSQIPEQLITNYPKFPTATVFPEPLNCFYLFHCIMQQDTRRWSRPACSPAVANRSSHPLTLHSRRASYMGQLIPANWAHQSEDSTRDLPYRTVWTWGRNQCRKLPPPTQDYLSQPRTQYTWQTKILKKTLSRLPYASWAWSTYASGEKSFSLQTSISLGVSLYAFSERDPWAVFMGSQKRKRESYYWECCHHWCSYSTSSGHTATNHTSFEIWRPN